VNLTERLGEKRILWCPFSEAGACVIKNADGECVREPSECAHYNPETDECVRVEAARAQAQAAKALKELAETVCMAYDRMPELMSRFFGGDADA